MGGSRAAGTSVACGGLQTDWRAEDDEGGSWRWAEGRAVADSRRGVVYYADGGPDCLGARVVSSGEVWVCWWWWWWWGSQTLLRDERAAESRGRGGVGGRAGETDSSRTLTRRGGLVKEGGNG